MSLCQCGCGQQTAITTKNHTRSGAIKGQPRRYVKGHNSRGERSPWWKGHEVGYRALHTYLTSHFAKRGICDECGEQSRTEYALIHDRSYTRSRSDYRELCKRCHNIYDGIDVVLQDGRRRAAQRQKVG